MTPAARIELNAAAGPDTASGNGRQEQWRWITLVAIVAAVVIAGRVLPIEGWLIRFDRWVAGQGIDGILIFAAAYAAATVLLVPGSLITMAAGFTFGLFWGTVVVTLGSTVGDTLAFLIARYLARQKVRQLAMKNRKFAAMDHSIGESGWKIVLLLRLSPLIPFNLSNYLYGLTAIRFWPYVWSSVVGVLPGTVLFVYFGKAGKASLQAISGQRVPRGALEMVILLCGLLMTAFTTFYISRIARKALHKARIDEDPST